MSVPDKVCRANLESVWRALLVSFLVASTSVSSPLQQRCDELEAMVKKQLLKAIHDTEDIGDRHADLVQNEPNIAVQARFLTFAAVVCVKEASDPTLNPEAKRFYYKKAVDRWVDFFRWVAELSPENRDQWLGKEVNWSALTKAQKKLVEAAVYLGDAACSAILAQTNLPDNNILETAVAAYEKIDEVWLNDAAIDNWGRAFHPPDRVLDTPEDEIRKVIQAQTWKLHWINYGEVVQRRAEGGVFKKHISDRFREIVARVRRTSGAQAGNDVGDVALSFTP